MNPEMILVRVHRFATRHQLFEPGPLLVAVSGGADSLTLLHVLLTLCDTFKITLHVATFDHGLRGAAGKQDLEAVRAIAAQWGIPVTTGSANVPTLAAEWHLGIEAAARRARYDFLAQTADALNIRQIATGHNLDDQAETVLMHVIRGSGLAGLRGMLPKSTLPGHSHLTLIRPLLDTPRADIDKYITALGIQPRVDSTNEDIRYTRNRLRHEVLPLLAEINPQVRAALARTAETAREDYLALRKTEPTFDMHDWGISMERREFVSLMLSQQRILIREAVERLSPGEMVSFERAQAAIDLALVGKKSSRIQLIGDIWFGTQGDHIWLGSGTRIGPRFQLVGLMRPYPPICPYLETNTVIKLEVSASYDLGTANGADWHLYIETASENRTTRESVAQFVSFPLFVQPDSHVELRTRRPGDRYEPLGMSEHSQKIKAALINMKVPVAWRDHLPILTINERIAGFVVPTQGGPIVHVAATNSASGAGSWWQFTFRLRAP